MYPRNYTENPRRRKFGVGAGVDLDAPKLLPEGAYLNVIGGVSRGLVGDEYFGP